VKVALVPTIFVALSNEVKKLVDDALVVVPLVARKFVVVRFVKIAVIAFTKFEKKFVEVELVMVPCATLTPAIFKPVIVALFIIALVIVAPLMPEIMAEVVEKLVPFQNCVVPVAVPDAFPPITQFPGIQLVYPWAIGSVTFEPDGIITCA
jgi:hypothetical protein